jgi:hypothetical protein
LENSVNTQSFYEKRISYEERIKELIGDNEKMAAILRQKMASELALKTRTDELNSDNHSLKAENETLKSLLNLNLHKKQ